MPEQTELFNISDYTDREIYTHLDHGLSPRSTRRKQPKRRKAIALFTRDSDCPSVHNSNKSRT